MVFLGRVVPARGGSPITDRRVHVVPAGKRHAGAEGIVTHGVEVVPAGSSQKADLSDRTIRLQPIRV